MITSMVIDMNLGDNSGTKQTVAGAQGNSHSTGRRKTKGATESSQKKNKQPQRRMGVEQLERLRLQERWKKMTELPSLPLPHPSLPPFTPSVLQQLNGVTNGGGVQFRQPQMMYFNRLNGVDYPMSTIQNSTTSELSSIQSYVKCVSNGCGVCYKKKRINGGSSTCSVNPYRKNAVKEMIEAGRPCRSSVQAAEVMSVHRNEVNAMTEYEFFPGKSGGGTTDMASAWCRSSGGDGGSVGIGGGGMLGLRSGEGSCVTAHHHGFNGNEEGNVSSLDLSLKLSY